jgi:serine/threonine protein kinase
VAQVWVFSLRRKIPRRPGLRSGCLVARNGFMQAKKRAIDSYNTTHLMGTQVGTATIVKELARGGMAIVFIAYQRSLKRRIALKLLPKSLLTPAKAALFQQEAESAAILFHPNIIPIYEVGETDEFIYLTMQLIRGATLTEILKRIHKQIVPSKRILPLKTTTSLIIQILDALSYAHHHDIIHCDIKPDNIMIDHFSQRPVITDFGIAKVLRGGQADDSKVRGTPLYMAPEQIVNEPVDPRADIYAVGVMLFQMLVSGLPIRRYTSSDRLIRDKLLMRNGIFLKKPSEINFQIRTDMDAIVFKATAYTPDGRFGSCREFIAELEHYQRQYLQ